MEYTTYSTWEIQILFFRLKNNLKLESRRRIRGFDLKVKLIDRNAM